MLSAFCGRFLLTTPPRPRLRQAVRGALWPVVYDVMGRHAPLYNGMGFVLILTVFLVFDRRYRTARNV